MAQSKAKTGLVHKGQTNRSAPTVKLPRDLQKQIDRHFASLKWLSRQITEVNADYERDSKTLTERYAHQLAPAEDEYKAHVRTLKNLLKKRAPEIFDATGSDRVETALGVVIRQIGEKLKTCSNTLELCEAQGFTEVIKIAKSLDRARLAEWPGDKLAMVAAEKRPLVNFSFDVKQAAGGPS